MKKQTLDCCPNCGFGFKAQNYMIGKSIRAILCCDKCDYVGLPILIDKEEYSKVNFPNKKIVRTEEPGNLSKTTQWIITATNVLGLLLIILAVYLTVTALLG